MQNYFLPLSLYLFQKFQLKKEPKDIYRQVLSDHLFSKNCMIFTVTVIVHRKVNNMLISNISYIFFQICYLYYHFKIFVTLKANNQDKWYNYSDRYMGITEVIIWDNFCYYCTKIFHCLL